MDTTAFSLLEQTFSPDRIHFYRVKPRYIGFKTHSGYFLQEARLDKTLEFFGFV